MDLIHVDENLNGSDENIKNHSVHHLPIEGDRNDEVGENYPSESEKALPKKQNWDKPIEFLLSCIAMSVGLGNLWRFPVTAFENGGGAFLIPYIIVLFVIGKPIYYMEMALGQFFSSGQVQVWDIAPAFRGVGWAMMISVVCLVTYYCSLMALSAFYLFVSFAPELPWSHCRPQWEKCFDSKPQDENGIKLQNQSSFQSSSDIYFISTVIKQKANIDDGIGYPEWHLTLCLIFSWLIIFLALVKGVKSSGKVAYFTALFPYVVLITLLIRGATLPGAENGILYFIMPQWEELLNPNVWMAAVTQCFFSLTVSFGPIIYYSSFNTFQHNFYRDMLIVTTMDTLTSLLAGLTIFSILGNLAYEVGIEDVSMVVKGGTGLAFVSYPDAISKFDSVPQVFSILFFIMLFTLGLGTAISLIGSVVTVFSEMIPTIQSWIITLISCVMGCLLGLMYITPGGQFILTLVDYHGSSFIVYIISTFEVIAVVWVYGLENFCKDIEFSVGIKVSAYWRVCWAVLIPVFLPVVLIYSFVNFKPLTYTGVSFPTSAIVLGWVLTGIGVLQIPLWAVIEYNKSQEITTYKKLASLFRSKSEWGPRNPQIKEEWRLFRAMYMEQRKKSSKGRHLCNVLLGIAENPSE